MTEFHPQKKAAAADVAAPATAITSTTNGQRNTMQADQINSTENRQDNVPNADGHGDLRAQILGIVDNEGATRAALAKEAGLPNSTFQAFLKGNYAGDNEKIAAGLTRWLATRAAARRRRAELPSEIDWQPTETARRIHQALEVAHLMPTISVIACGAGTGKTVTCRRYASEANGVWVATMDPEIRTVPRMLMRLAEALRLGQHSVVQRSNLIRERLGGGNRLLIVDEAQTLTREQLEMLRCFSDTAGCGLALVGNQHVATRRGDSVQSWGQLESRIGLRLQVEKPSAADVDALLAARGIADEEAIALLRKVGARPGALRMMGQIVHAASLMAVGAGAEALDAGHVRAALRERGMTAPGGL